MDEVKDGNSQIKETLVKARHQYNHFIVLHGNKSFDSAAISAPV